MPAQVTIPGSVGDEIETFSFGSDGTGVRIRVAVNDLIRGEETTNWYRLTCFGRVADKAQDLAQKGQLVKGSKIVATGSLMPREYTNSNGETRTSLDVTANYLEVVHYPANRQQSYQDDYYEEESENEPPF